MSRPTRELLRLPVAQRRSSAFRPSNATEQVPCPMSIYRGYRPLPSDVQVRQFSDRQTAQIPSPLPSPPHQRRAQPVLELLPRTAIWIALLPKPVRPNALAAQFARVANLLALSGETHWRVENICVSCLPTSEVGAKGSRQPRCSRSKRFRLTTRTCIDLRRPIWIGRVQTGRSGTSPFTEAWARKSHRPEHSPTLIY